MPGIDRRPRKFPELSNSGARWHGGFDRMIVPAGSEWNAETIVAGAGPAGIAAAFRAHESGAQVIVIDDNPTPGGQIWRGGRSAHQDSLSRRWTGRFQQSGIRLLSNAQIIAADARNRTLLVETQGEALKCRFNKLIIATGARELFLPFPGWTLPGVMGVGGLQALAKSGLPIAGKRIVIAGSGPLLLAVAAYLRKHRARVKLIAEQASASALARFSARLLLFPEKMIQAGTLQLSLAGIPYKTSCWVEVAEGAKRLERLHLRCGAKSWIEDCDYAAVAFGLYPNTELASLLGCEMNGSPVLVDDYGRSSIENVFSAGECTGIGGVDLSIVEGEIAGFASSGRLDTAQRLFSKRKKARGFAEALKNSFALRTELKKLPQPDTLVCRCEDVSFQRLEAHSSFRAAKLHTRCAMGPCQGRVCGPAADFLFGWKTESIRPPIFPARIESLIVNQPTSQEVVAKQ